MTAQRDAEGLSRVREEFSQVVVAYNSAIRAGKVRAIRSAVTTAHQAIFSLTQTIQASFPGEADLIAEIEEAFMDVRWGREIAKKSG